MVEKTKTILCSTPLMSLLDSINLLRKYFEKFCKNFGGNEKESKSVRKNLFFGF